MNEPSFLPPDREEYFGILSKAFSSDSRNNVIDIPVKRGTGVIKNFNDGNGLSMITWNVCLDHPLHFKRIAQEGLGQKNFRLFFILTPDHFVISKDAVNCIPVQDSRTVLFISSDVELVFTITPKVPVRVVELEITGYWLAKEYSNSNQSTSPFLTSLIAQLEPTLLNESIPLSSFHSILDLYKNIVAGNSDHFYVRAKILSLLSDIFLQPLQKVNAADTVSQVNEKMVDAEQLIVSYLYKCLPPLSVIAKLMAMSESTLKRSFKLQYGLSIYEYYLTRKMETAKQLFNEQDISVKEVAYMLGYEKVSSFIEIFKKHYQYSPGMLKKVSSVSKTDRLNKRA